MVSTRSGQAAICGQPPAQVYQAKLLQWFQQDPGRLPFVDNHLLKRASLYNQISLG
jgi:hypothetical protein